MIHRLRLSIHIHPVIHPVALVGMAPALLPAPVLAPMSVSMTVLVLMLMPIPMLGPVRQWRVLLATVEPMPSPQSPREPSPAPAPPQPLLTANPCLWPTRTSLHGQHPTPGWQRSTPLRQRHAQSEKRPTPPQRLSSRRPPPATLALGHVRSVWVSRARPQPAQAWA